jgi:Ca2+-binding EF-hand superfamily protein
MPPKQAAPTTMAGKKRGNSPSQRGAPPSNRAAPPSNRAAAKSSARAATNVRGGSKGTAGKNPKAKAAPKVEPPIAEEAAGGAAAGAATEGPPSAAMAAAPAAGDLVASAAAAEAPAPTATPQKQVAAAEPVPGWAQKAYGLFDRIDVDGSGFVDKDELLSKLKLDGELEELLGAKRWGLAEAKAAAAAETEQQQQQQQQQRRQEQEVEGAGGAGAEGGAGSEASPPTASPEEVRRARARAREARRNKLMQVLFDEFDVTENAEGVAAPTHKFTRVEEEGKPAKGRELISEALAAALSRKRGDQTRAVGRSDAQSYPIKCASGEAFDGLQHDDYILLPSTGVYFQLSSKDDKLNRDEFRDMVRLGRIRMIFNSMDVDGSGYVDRNELATKLQADNELEEQLGLKAVSGIKVYTSLIYVNLFRQFDVNNDGQLSRSEFEKMLTDSTSKAREEASRQAEVAAAAAVAASVDVS